MVFTSKDKNFDFSALAHIKEALEHGMKGNPPAFWGNTESSVFASQAASAPRLQTSEHEKI